MKNKKFIRRNGWTLMGLINSSIRRGDLFNFIIFFKSSEFFYFYIFLVLYFFVEKNRFKFEMKI